MHSWPNINCGFAQCQDSPDNVKTRRGYWRKKLAGKILPKRDWCEAVGSETLATSRWEQWEGKSSSQFCMMANKLCVVEACFEQQNGEFKLGQFYMAGVLVTRTNKSSFSHGLCEHSCSQARWGFTAAIRTPLWHCLCIHQTFLFFLTQVCRSKIKRKLTGS